MARVALLVGIRGDRSTTTCFQYMQHKSALKIEQEIKCYKFDDITGKLLVLAL